MSEIWHISGTLRGICAPQGANELWVAGGKVTFTRPEGEVSGHITGWVYPGLVDAHAHPGVSYEKELTPPDEIRRRLDVMAWQGVTSAREMGAQANSHSVEHPVCVIRAGQHLARYRRYIRNMPIDVEPAGLAEAVATQARAGDGWVKIVGDWIDRTGGAQSDLRPLWPLEALREAVAAAHENGARVAVHTFAEETIADLLEAGVDCIEHGCGMSLEQIQEARRRGIHIDPTIRQLDTFPQIAAAAHKYPVYKEHMLRLHSGLRAYVERLLEGEALLIMGSDSGELVATCGMPAEIRAAAQYGMPVSVAMHAATLQARRFLGLPQVSEGERAELVIYEGDPETDIATLEKPRAVILGEHLLA